MICFDDFIIMCFLISIFLPAILILISSLCHFKGYITHKWLQYQYDRLADTAECTICLENTKEGGLSGAYRLPCSHWFHKACLHRWLQHNNNCPNCRHVVNYWNGERIYPASRMLVEFDDIEEDDQIVLRPTVNPNFHPRTWTRMRTSRVQILF